MNERKNFSLDEDYMLIKLVRMHGIKHLKIITMHFNKLFKHNKKSSSDLKKRWFGHLLSKTKKKGWTLLEEYIFFEVRNMLGNKWALISQFLPGRTDNDIKNHFYSTLRKNIKNYAKSKSNFSCIKDKIKSFYIIMYVKQKMILFQTNNQESQSNQINEDINYLELMGISAKNQLIQNDTDLISSLKNYLNSLCIDIINDEYNPNLNIKSDYSIEKCQFNIDNAVDLNSIQTVISEIAFKASMLTSVKYILSNPENKRKSNINTEYCIGDKEIPHTHNDVVIDKANKNMNKRERNHLKYNKIRHLQTTNNPFDTLVENYLNEDEKQFTGSQGKSNHSDLRLDKSSLKLFVSKYNKKKKFTKGLQYEINKNELETIINNFEKHESTYNSIKEIHSREIDKIIYDFINKTILEIFH